MIVFSPIPDNYLPEIQRIERLSNPYPWQAESLQLSLQEYAHLGAFSGTDLLALVLYRQIADEAEIIHLVCDKAHQGNGYSRALLSELCRVLTKNGAKALFLEVREDNQRAQSLYANAGFETVGRRPNYYGGRHDALIQRLDL